MSHDDAADSKYRPYLLESSIVEADWISQLELDAVAKMARDDLSKTGKPIRILILYGSLTRRYGPPTLGLCASSLTRYQDRSRNC
jgi:arsenic resistance protein ArsH